VAPLTDSALWELVKHLKQWLTNLRRAGAARKRESIDALRAVIVAARSTRVYLRRIGDTGQADHAEEARLARMWTELGFGLKDLGLGALAKRCDVTGRYWSDPAQFDPEYLHRADVGLERMEKLARQTLAEVERGRSASSQRERRSTMKVTVCQFDNRAGAIPDTLRQITAQLDNEPGGLLLLPEMCFFPWLAAAAQPDPARWLDAVAAHAANILELGRLGAEAVIGTRPTVGDDGEYRNQAYLWTPDPRVLPLHEKYYLPDEPGYWEARWYTRGVRRFDSCRALEATIGVQICTEMWFFEWARHFARAGVELLCIPRATPHATADKWIAGGRAAAVCSGAYCLSSNLWNPPGSEADCGGPAWIISPEGDLLALTDPDSPVVTLELDLGLARRAKSTYPRYVAE
jgi:N-carbamoylputrescine amidase